MIQKFDYYDAIAHLIPGTIGCLFILYAIDLLGTALPKLDVGSLGAAGIGVAVAYTLGHLLQSVASSLEPLYYAIGGGKPSIRLLEKKSQQFSDPQRRQLIDELVRFFGVAEQFPEDPRGKRNFYQRLFERCMALCNRHKLGRVDAFVAAYGFHRVLLTTFLLSFAASVGMWAFQESGYLNLQPEKLALLRLLFGATGIGVAIEVFRARKRAYYYAQEVLLMTADYVRSSTNPSSDRPVGN